MENLPNKKTVTVYCPRGCNVSSAFEDEPVDYCVSCGSPMTPDDEDCYDDVHYSIEERGIAKAKAELGAAVMHNAGDRHG